MVLMILKAGGGEQGSTQLEKKLQSDLSFLQPAFAHLCASQDDKDRKSIACSTLEVFSPSFSVVSACPIIIVTLCFI